MKSIDKNSLLNTQAKKRRRERNATLSTMIAMVLSLLVVSPVLLTGCAGSPESTTSTTTSPATGGAGGSLTGQSSALPLVNSPNPGPYKIVTKNGAMLREGRFPAGKSGGTLVRSVMGDPKTFNPWVSADTNSSEMGGLMFSGLVTLDPYTGDVIPDLAEKFEVDPDNVTYTVKLREGLKWSDGKPITSEDVVYTWNKIIAGGYGNSSLRDVTTVAGKSPTVTAVDDLTIKFVTPSPFAPFLRLLGMPIAPAHAVKPVIEGKNGRQAFNGLWSVTLEPKTLVVSGPYKLRKFIPAQRVEFEPNKNYAAINKQGDKLPYITALTYIIVPDPNTNLLKFRSQEIDITGVRPRDVVDLLGARQKENFRLYNLGQDISTTFVAFNMNKRVNPKTKKPYVPPYKSAWFNDRNFRQAINHAINRDQMVANYFKGIGFPLFTAEPPSSPFFNDKLKAFKPDVDYAMSLLEQSGFKKKDDGFLYDKAGHKVEFTMTGASGSTFIDAVGNMFINDMKKLGIKVNLQLIEFNIMGDKLNNALDWETCIAALRAGDPLEPNDGSNVWKSTGRLHWFDLRLPDAQGKQTKVDIRPWEHRLDEIFEEGAQTLDKTKRTALYQEYQKIIYDEAPYVYLVSPMSIVAVRNTLQNYQPTFLSQSSAGLHNLDEIWKK